jgi:ABC-type siderophore export system fused ATPase/permease subunit
MTTLPGQPDALSDIIGRALPASESASCTAALAALELVSRLATTTTTTDEAARLRAGVEALRSDLIEMGERVDSLDHLVGSMDSVEREQTAMWARLTELEGRGQRAGWQEYLGRLSSRKLQVTIVAIVTTIVGMVQGSVPAEIGIPGVVVTALGYLTAEGYSDGQAAKAGTVEKT